MAFDPMTGKPIESNDNGDMEFDPMTGELIKKQSEPTPETGGFDPMTGQPIGQPQQSAPVQETSGFDPMTGQPIGQPQQSAPVQETSGFDPMTGQPIGQPQQSAPVQETGGFDPMTGKPLGQPQQSAPVQPTGGFDPMTGQPVQGASNNSKGKKNIKIKMPVIIGGVAAVLAVVLVIAAVSSGLFLGKAGKVMMATANTFKDRPHFVEVFDSTYSIIGQNKYTIALSGDMDGVKLDGEFRNGGKEKQLSVQLKQSGSKIDMMAGIDSKNAKFQVPQLSNYVFVYDYNKISTGYISDEVDEDTLTQINTMLESLVDQTDVKKFYSDVFKIFTSELKSVSFVNAEKEEFTIDDKDVDCKGYTAVITSSNMIHIVDKMEKLINDEYASLIQTTLVSEMAIGSLEDWEEVSAEAFDEIREGLEDMEDIELSFYLYKNKLAALVLRIPEADAEAELRFEGGDYRMQNMTLKVDDERYRLSGSDDGSKEQFSLEVRSGSYKQQIANLEYNYDSGKFSVSLADEVTVKGKMTGSRSEINLKISEIDMYYYSMSPDLDITVKKGAKMEKFDGKEFDLGKADEDDYMELIEDIEDKIYDKDLDWITYIM